MYAKEFSTLQLDIDEFGQIFWGTKNSIIKKTDNKALTRFFQA